MGFFKKMFGGRRGIEEQPVRETGSGAINPLSIIDVTEEVQDNLTRPGATAQEIWDAALATAIANRVTVRIGDITKVDKCGPTVLPM
jgi:hypothetical protein